MKYAVVLFAAATFCFCDGYVMIESTKHANGRCASKIYDLGAMAFGEEKDVPGHCMKASCHENGHISYEGCSVVDLPENCKFMEADRNLPFPNCCQYDYHCR